MTKNIRQFRNFTIQVALLFLLGSVAVNAVGARYVTVATIGNLPHIKKYESPQDLLTQIKNFWLVELKQVIPYKPDIILLPEECDFPSEGLSKKEKDNYLELRKNEMFDFFASIAKNNHCYIAFGMKRLADDGIWRNSSILLDREGKIAGIYDKNYPTISELTSGIKAGNDVSVFQCDFGRVALVICFDLNFDELRQKYVESRPDLILFSSMYHGGDALQSSWAYSCRSFFVSATGFRNIPAEIRNPLGQIVNSNTNYYDFAVSKINLDYELVHLDYNWDKLRALKEKYKDVVSITDPGKLGAVLITSEDKNISAKDMTDEFKIELLDDYFNQSRNTRLKSIESK
jgi:hypothetical protein